MGDLCVAPFGTSAAVGVAEALALYPRSAAVDPLRSPPLMSMRCTVVRGERCGEPHDGPAPPAGTVDDDETAAETPPITPVPFMPTSAVVGAVVHSRSLRTDGPNDIWESL